MTFGRSRDRDRDQHKGRKSSRQARDRDCNYVQTSNLPGPGNTPFFLPAAQMALAKRYAEAPPSLPQPTPAGDQDARRAAAAGVNLAATVPGVPKDGSVFVRDERLVPVLSPDQKLMDVWPTYRVHVYYDTGRKQVVEGTPRPVLAPLVPFGLFLSHDGPLYGFTHALRGLGGVTLEEIAPNFYRVRIKNEGSIRVATHITSEERPGSGGEPGAMPCCRPTPVQVNSRVLLPVPVRSVGDGARSLADTDACLRSGGASKPRNLEPLRSYFFLLLDKDTPRKLACSQPIGGPMSRMFAHVSLQCQCQRIGQQRRRAWPSVDPWPTTPFGNGPSIPNLLPERSVASLK